MQEHLKLIGHQVEIIDYRPKYLTDPYKLFEINRIKANNIFKLFKNILREIIIFPTCYKRYNKFKSFITNKLNLSIKIKSNQIPSKYDIYIFGSDQIWNSKLTKGYDDIYFGKFTFPKNNKKYIAYAASMETNSLSNKCKESLKENLSNFNNISVREENLVKLLQPLTPNNIQHVLDPTLLISKQKWTSIAKKPNINKKYVLVYQVRSNTQTINIAKNIAKQIDGIVIETVSHPNKKCLNNKYQSASPEEFLGLIKYAECIITTSFHGTAFSVIFNKPFYSILLNDGNDSRVVSLLNNIGLSNRLINLNDKVEFSSISYDKVIQKLSILQEKSFKYINESTT